MYHLRGRIVRQRRARKLRECRSRSEGRVSLSLPNNLTSWPEVQVQHPRSLCPPLLKSPMQRFLLWYALCADFIFSALPAVTISKLPSCVLVLDTMISGKCGLDAALLSFQY